jgi:hypothetical protein
MPDLQAVLQDTLDTIEEKRRQVAALNDEIGLLEDERRGLELAIRRRGGEPKGDSVVTSPTSPYWRSLGRGEAVLQVLRANPLPIGPAEIVTYLERTGRQGDTYPLVSAALTHLKRKGLADAKVRGQWTATSPNGVQPVLGEGA